MNEADGGSTSSITVANAGYGRHGAWGNAFTTPIFKPNSVLLVKCYPAQPAGAELFDAHYIAHSIRAKYKLPDASPPPAAIVSEATPPAASMPNVALTPQAAPSANIAQQVLAAQRVATSQGCGDVIASPDGSFQSSCATGTLIIECDGAECHPVRMKSN